MLQNTIKLAIFFTKWYIDILEYYFSIRKNQLTTYDLNNFRY